VIVPVRVGVNVIVGVPVRVGVRVIVPVSVRVGVCEGVNVIVGVCVFVGVSVIVGVRVTVGVTVPLITIVTDIWSPKKVPCLSAMRQVPLTVPVLLVGAVIGIEISWIAPGTTASPRVRVCPPMALPLIRAIL
jgi:hypothetical protein